MPVERDANGERILRLEFDVPGTPEAIWHAVATGPGIGAWFVPSTVEERVGGRVTFELGDGMTGAGVVTAWEPPRRFAYEEPDWNGDAPPLRTTFLIEPHGAGHRLAIEHRLATSETRWDDALASMEGGWAPFVDVLRIYAGEFAGLPSASARPLRPFAGTMDEAWREVTGSLGLADARAGERRTSADGAPPFAGAVVRVSEGPMNREALLRIDAPAPGVLLVGAFDWAGRTMIGIGLYFYGDGAPELAARQGARWRTWLAERFPEVAPAAS